MATPPPQQPRRSAGDAKKTTPPASMILTRNGARKAKIQTRAMSAGAKPSASVVAAKKKAQQKKKQNVDTVIKDHYQIAMDSKAKSKGPTGFVTEPRMAEHRCLWDENYPECPERLIGVVERCKELGLISQCEEFSPRAASKEELTVLHSPSVYDMMETTHQNQDLKYLEDLSSKYDAIYIHPVSEIVICATREQLFFVASVYIESQASEGFYNGFLIRILSAARDSKIRDANTLVSCGKNCVTENLKSNIAAKSLCAHCLRSKVNVFEPSTHELALIAAGSTIDMVDRIVAGGVQNGAAFVRPPGHHAMRAEPCGYCFYNNVALAASHALNKGVSRILIVDWDVHHGQGTQQMFYDDPRVVYFSIHRYEHGSFWPSLRHSNFNYTGTGAGAYHNFNVPLNKVGMKDGDYLAIWHQLLLPMALEYQPELIIISAGYDAALGCPEGEMEVTPACYAHLLNMLMSVCPSVCVVLEGGYCLPSLAEGAALTLRTLLGHPPPKLTEVTEPCDSIRETILNCIYVHKPYWNCFNYQPTYSIDASVPNVCDRGKQKHTVEVKWEGDETRPDRFATRDCYPIQDDNFKRRVVDKLNHLRLVTDLSLAKHPVCYIYDQAMLKHKNICEPGHVECPERVMRIHERHRDYGLLDRLHQLQARPATDYEITTCHTKEYLNRLKELSTTKLRELHSQKDQYDSVYFHPDSLESAAVAAGSVIQMVDAVVTQTASSGICVVRPPGHHADSSVPSGFCLLNNAALAAKHAVAKYKARVLLLDWDVHHGNGTQNLTLDSDQILYMSIHRYDDGSFFPHSKDADYTVVGTGKGEGFNVNIPWNKRGMGDTEYLAAFTQIVLPIAYEFNPDLVIVSAGFDACVGDPLGGCKVSPECYGRMTNLLKGLAGGRIVLCLEGGYNITSISYAMTMCTKALLGDPLLHHYDTKPTPHWSAIETINNVLKTHNKFWKNLKFQLALPAENVLEPPAPSRGLEIDGEKSDTSNSSIEDELNKTSRSLGDLNTLESQLEGLSIEAKCKDGIHCGTDDENESPKSSKSEVKRDVQKTDLPEKVECKKACLDKTIDAGSCSKKELKGDEKVSDQASSENNQKDTNKKVTLVDYLAENMQAIVDGEMFAVIPMPWCPHLESLYAIPSDIKFEQGVKCIDCDHTVENWVCLHCYVTACGRSINGHMEVHYNASRHALVLSLADLSVWCYECDSYVDNALLYDAKNNAHKCKFGEDMPWCYRSDTINMR